MMTEQIEMMSILYDEEGQWLSSSIFERLELTHAMRAVRSSSWNLLFGNNARDQVRKMPESVARAIMTLQAVMRPQPGVAGEMASEGASISKDDLYTRHVITVKKVLHNKLNLQQRTERSCYKIQVGFQRIWRLVSIDHSPICLQEICRLNYMFAKGST